MYSNLQVESIVLSIISMLSSPNDESPANVEAAVSLTIYFISALFALVILCGTYLHRREEKVN